jgi:hypothetical protein
VSHGWTSDRLVLASMAEMMGRISDDDMGGEPIDGRAGSIAATVMTGPTRSACQTVIEQPIDAGRGCAVCTAQASRPALTPLLHRGSTSPYSLGRMKTHLNRPLHFATLFRPSNSIPFNLLDSFPMASIARRIRPSSRRMMKMNNKDPRSGESSSIYTSNTLGYPR